MLSSCVCSYDLRSQCFNSGGSLVNSDFISGLSLFAVMGYIKDSGALIFLSFNKCALSCSKKQK